MSIDSQVKLMRFLNTDLFVCWIKWRFLDFVISCIYGSFMDILPFICEVLWSWITKVKFVTSEFHLCICFFFKLAILLQFAYTHRTDAYSYFFSQFWLWCLTSSCFSGQRRYLWHLQYPAFCILSIFLGF